MQLMKNSRIKWIGDIPENWNVVKTKYNFTCSKTIAGSSEKYYERLALTMNGVVKRSKEDVNGMQPKKFTTYQIIHKDSLVFKLIDLQNITTSRVGLSPYDGIVSPAYIVLNAKKSGDVLPKFAEYYYLMMWYNNIFNAISDDGVRNNLTSTDLLNLPIAFPDTNKQEAIISYLNSKCTEINSLLESIHEEINTLEEYKKSIISETVTKGIQLDTEMKDSGIKWIGKIPNAWGIVKLKYHLKRRTIKNHGKEEVLSLYRELGIIPKNSRDDNHNVTSEDTSKYLFVRKGDFVINKMKAWQGSVAVSDYDGIVSPAYYVYEFYTTAINRRYFHYLLRNKCYANEFRRLSGGIREGQWDLSAMDLENILILIPPKDEQKTIAEYLDAKCTEIDSLIRERKEQLETLVEYKKSLIYEYVTGKKEVCA